MNRSKLSSVDRTTLVDGLTDHINDSSKTFLTDRHHDRVASVFDCLASDETFSGVQSDGSDIVSTQVLGDFKDKSVLSTLNLEGVVDRWKLTVELDIDDGTNNL